MRGRFRKRTQTVSDPWVRDPPEKDNTIQTGSPGKQGDEQNVASEVELDFQSL